MDRANDPFEGWVEGVAYVQRDETLLREGRFAIRVGVVASPLISLGVAQASDHPAVARAAAYGWPTSRRRSGGTGLFHARGDLLWSLLLPRADPRVGRDFASAYGRLGRGVAEFLGTLGLRGQWVPAKSIAPEYCLLSGRGHVLEVEGRAIAGAAQHLTAAALLHHGTVSVTLEPAPITATFEVPELVSRQYLVGLSELGIDRAPEALGRSLAASLARSLDA